MDVITENTVNPAKRFSSFKSNWMTKLYEDIYSFYSTNSLSRDKLNYENGEVFNIHYGDIHTKFSTMFDLTKELVPVINVEVDLSKCQDEKYCQEGDLVIADASEDYGDIGKTIELINLNNEKVLAGLHTFLARPNNYKMARGFAGYLLQSWKVRRQVMVIAQGTKVLGIAKGRLGKVKLNIPEFEEQQKIASFLSSVDDKLKQLTKKKELLKEYKKGVMQKIFSQELRFKDDVGNNYPDCVELHLFDFLIPEFRERDKPICNYLAIGVRSHCKGTFQKPNSDPLKIAMEKLFLVKENDLIVNITFAWEGAIALVKKEDEGGYVSHRFPTYLFNRSIVLYEFFKYIMIKKNFRHQLNLKSPGGAGRNRVLNKKEFLKIKVNIPSIEEQKKIANFLSSLDSKIELVSTQIENTKAFKKGLLQQMFV